MTKKSGALLAICLTAIGVLATWWFSRSTDPFVYQVRVQILEPDGGAVEGATVRTSAGNERQLLPDGWWEVEIPRAKVPTDGKVTIWAEQGSRVAETEQVLSDSQVVDVSLRFDALPEVEIRGAVVDMDNEAVAGARVSVVGFGAEAVLTGQAGEFIVRSHATVDETVHLRVEHESYGAVQQSHRVGTVATVVLEERD